MDGLDGLNDAIDEAWNDGSIRGDNSSQLTGRTDSMDLATELLFAEQARDGGPEAEASARRNGDTALALDALEAHEDSEYANELYARGIPEELHDDPDFHRYVVDADGDIELAAERWDANIDRELAEAEAERAEQWDAAMVEIVGALERGEVDFYSLPPDLQQEALRYAQERPILDDMEAERQAELADRTYTAEQVVEVAEVLEDEAGPIASYVFGELIDQGFDIETAANSALEAVTGGARATGSEGLDDAANLMASDLRGEW